MERDKNITIVVFRKYKDGDIIALFPEVEDTTNFCMSYQFVGQHGGACYYGVVGQTKLASPEEYASLKKHLEVDFGYNFKVHKRWTYKRLNKTA